MRDVGGGGGGVMTWSQPLPDVSNSKGYRLHFWFSGNEMNEVSFYDGDNSLLFKRVRIFLILCNKLCTGPNYN